jgi:carbon storage regulator CsrA
MLVLSRQINELVLLPNLEITICVLKVRRKSVVLEINAPERIRITRTNPHNLVGVNETAAGGPEFSQ